MDREATGEAHPPLDRPEARPGEKPRRADNGRGRQADEPREDHARPIVICPTIFQGLTTPARRWIVPEWIPYGVVTGLYGDGGVGKSLVAQQLQTGVELGSAWLGLPVEKVASLGVYCEDDEEGAVAAAERHQHELLRRLRGARARRIGCRASARTTS